MKNNPYEQIAIMGILMWDLCLNGSGIGSDIYRHMGAQPKVGDLVLEMSTAYMRVHRHQTAVDARFNSGGLGFFVRTSVEPMENPDEWATENPDYPCPTETVWYIMAMETGQELRWTNCRFVRLPATFRDQL